MTNKFYFTTPDNRPGYVIFTMTETEDAERRYGVRCDLYIDGEISGTETVNERFFTLRETELVIERLCKIEGMPGTIADIM